MGGALALRQCVRQRMFIFNLFVYYAIAKPSWVRKILYSNMNVDEINFQFRLIPVRDSLLSSLGKHHVR